MSSLSPAVERFRSSRNKPPHPAISRAALVISPQNPATAFYSRVYQKFAPALGIQPFLIPVQDLTEIEQAIALFAREPNGGLLFPPDVTITLHRQTVTAAVARF